MCLPCIKNIFLILFLLISSESFASVSAEQIYYRWHEIKPMAVLCIVAGLFWFGVYSYHFSKNKNVSKKLRFLSDGMLLIVFIFLTSLLALRTLLSGHLPLSNAFETMHMLAWLGLLLTLLFARRFRLFLPFGFLLCGFSLLVAEMGNFDPTVAKLVPVLSSPLLSIHVTIIMLSYALLAFVMLNGLTAIFLHFFRKNSDEQIFRLQTVSQLMLYPAVFCLAAGIFIGAVWANQSWGRYWGWDPKEVWALITMMVYSTAFHSKSLPFLQKPLYFHVFTVVAFLAVLFTYFGVNFLLGGLHSYA